MLTLTIILPSIGALGLITYQGSNKDTVLRIKRFALTITIITFIISIILWLEFDSSTSDYQFTATYIKGIVSFTNFSIGIDGISLYFVILTTFLLPICILSNWNNIDSITIKYYLISFLILETLLIAVFSVLDLILFYIFFESVLIPLFLIVGVWGSGNNTIRIRAAFLLFLYTLFGSLFMLIAFIVIYYNIGSSDFQVISLHNISLESQKYLWIAIFISIAIKTPLIPGHIWLPRAHAEAPLAGSIILAGIILKLALYGYIRIILQFIPDASHYYAPLIQTFAIITLIYASLATLRQTDFKALVAYSSVAHAATIVLGVFSNTVQGIEGAIFLGIAHAFVSPALFILVGGVLYDRYHSRIIKYYRGITTYIPLFSVFFFVFSISNAAVPLSANWLGEFLCLTGIFQKSPIICIIAASGIVLSAAYSIWLYNRIAFGSFSPYISYTTDINNREFILLLPLLIITVVLGVFPNIILNNLHVSVSNLIYFTLLLY